MLTVIRLQGMVPWLAQSQCSCCTFRFWFKPFGLCHSSAPRASRLSTVNPGHTWSKNEKERNMKQPCGLPFDAFGLLNDKVWNYTFEAKMKEAMGFAAPRAIKDAKIGQLQHPNLQVQSALESSGFEVRSGWRCHWKASNWQLLSFYLKKSWIFDQANLISNELEKFHAAFFQCLLWYPFQWLLASQEDLAAASALHDLTLRRATALCRLQAECLSQRPLNKFTLQGTNISLSSGYFWVADFPFPNMGYVLVSWRVRKKQNLQPTNGPLGPQHHFRPGWFSMYPGCWLSLRWTC